ncbi:MAG: hypothetical protein KBS94_06855 [Prevotella sp.]|nr:hypothetical protein [Candidatus Equicola faecalis]
MKKHFLLLMMALASMAVFNSCDSDDEYIPIPVRVSDGLFVLNEGNFYSGIDGSLSYLDYETDIMTNNMFKTINGKSLGGTPNDAIIFSNAYYGIPKLMIIPATDENLVWILRSDLTIADTIHVESPRNVVGGNVCIYITSYTGKVTKLNLLTGERAESNVIGDYLEDITFFNGDLYVCNAYDQNYSYKKNVIKLDATTMEKICDIPVVDNPTRIETDGHALYVLSMGNYADVSPMLQMISATNEVTPLCKCTSFAINGNRIYYIDTPFDGSSATYGVYDLTAKQTMPFIEGKEIEYPSDIAADPVTGDVFMTAYHLSQYGYGDYSAPGYVVRYTSEGKYCTKYDVGVGPHRMIFNTGIIYE